MVPGVAEKSIHRKNMLPVIIMAAIPFSLIGILPAHWAFGAFFTTTSMIGFMAGAGIVVRNSIILVDFIKLRVKQGMALSEAVIDAGAIRFRPMMLTAIAYFGSGTTTINNSGTITGKIQKASRVDLINAPSGLVNAVSTPPSCPGLFPSATVASTSTATPGRA
jgi:hypothetical protein